MKNKTGNVKGKPRRLLRRQLTFASASPTLKWPVSTHYYIHVSTAHSVVWFVSSFPTSSIEPAKSVFASFAPLAKIDSLPGFVTSEQSFQQLKLGANLLLDTAHVYQLNQRKQATRWTNHPLLASNSAYLTNTAKLGQRSANQLSAQIWLICYL